MYSMIYFEVEDFPRNTDIHREWEGWVGVSERQVLGKPDAQTRYDGWVFAETGF